MIRTAVVSAAGLLTFASLAVAHPPHPVIVAHEPVVPVYTLDTFARDFRPVEGHHRILILHPVSKCPVEVCFELPCGKLKEFDVNRRSVEFDYGKHEVRLIFRLNGKVDVKSN